MTRRGAGRGAARPRAGSHAGEFAAALRWAPLVLVAAATVFLAANGIRLTRGLEYFDPRNGDCLFWTEGAVQFRYARMVAEGTPIPARDTALQSPEGVAPRAHLCLAMERFVGGSYRALGGLFGRPPFHVWAAYAPHVVAALAVPAAFAMAAAVWGSAWAGALAAALYACSLATVARSIGSFGHEDFALPFLFVAAACLARLVGRPDAPAPPSPPPRASLSSRLDGPIAAAALATGLGAWHFSRFAFLVLVLALGARLLVAPEGARGRVARALAWATAGALAAGLAFEVLRASQFLLAPPFLLAIALLAGYALERIRGGRAAASLTATQPTSRPAFPARGPTPLRRLLVVLLVFAPLFALASIFPAEKEGYAHVYALFLAKLRFLGVKPEDPVLLSPEARSLWIEDFASPSAYLVVAMFGAPALLAAAALRARRERKGPRASAARADCTPPDRTSPDPEAFALLVVLVVLWGISFLLVKRLFVFFAFYLTVFAGGAVFAALAPPITGHKSSPGARRLRVVPILLVLAAVGFEAFKVVAHGRESAATTPLRRLLKRMPEALTIPNWHATDLAIVEWIRNRTQPADAFVARIGASPMVLTYAGRPVVLHSKYEVPGVRARARAFDEALYGGEVDLYRFCREHGARYYLHESRVALESGPDSERYVGRARRLRTSSAAFRLQFAGEESRYFTPLFRNMSYCVYRVAELADTILTSSSDTVAPLPPQPLYDIARFGGQTLDQEFFDDGATAEVVASMEESIALLVRAQVEASARRYERALPLLERAHALNPSLAGVNTYLGLARAMRGDNARALEFCEREIAVSPDLSLAYANLGYVEANLGRYADARAHLERAIALEPANPGPRAMLAQVEAIERGRSATAPVEAAPGASR
jgi:tetratricopeptide (TPR) repeat protein